VPREHTLNRDYHSHPRNIVGKRIRELRKTAKPRSISQEDLCGRVAVYGVTFTRDQIAKIETGKRRVFDFEAVAIAKALKVSLQYLVSGHE